MREDDTCLACLYGNFLTIINIIWASEKKYSLYLCVTFLFEFLLWLHMALYMKSILYNHNKVEELNNK